MEWSWRTILILLGLLAIAAILIDGFRRMQRNRAEALRFDLQSGSDFPDDEYNPELPGEVRVVSADSEPKKTEAQRKEPTLGGKADEASTSDEVPLAHNEVLLSADEPESLAAPATDKKQAASDDTLVKTTVSEEKPKPSPLIPRVKPVDLSEQVPVLLDVEELGDEGVFDEGAEGIISAPRVVSRDAHAGAHDTDARNAEADASAVESETKLVANDDANAQQEGDANTEAAAELSSAADEVPDDALPEVEDPANINDPHLEYEVDAVPETNESLINYASPDAEVLANRPDPSLVLVIHALARDPEGFRGHDLMFLFNSCDLRYGEKDIFHRFEEADGQGRIQFSVAQIHNPGTFDPATMADTRYHGLSFFMSLPGAKRPLEAYEAMSEMAMVVSRNLKADVLDESHSAMTPQTMEHERQQILDYERQQRLAAKKQRL